MANRRRFAVIVTPLLALLAALLLGASAASAQEAGGTAGVRTLTLESATATTLTVTWDVVPGAWRYDVSWRAPSGGFGPDYVATTAYGNVQGVYDPTVATDGTGFWSYGAFNLHALNGTGVQRVFQLYGAYVNGGGLALFLSNAPIVTF